MRLLIHFTVIFISYSLVSTIALGHNGENTADWGYIRFDNRAAFTVATKCYNKYGRGGTWKRTNGGGGFRSCHGAYMRVDPIGFGTNYPAYFSRSRLCKDKRLYITYRGFITDNDINTEIECK